MMILVQISNNEQKVVRGSSKCVNCVAEKSRYFKQKFNRINHKLLIY